MKLRYMTFLLAILMAGAMAIAIHLYGAHSTPGIRLTMLNVPGALAAVWAADLIGENVFAYATIPLVNWAFYFYAIKGILAVKRAISE